MFFKGKRDRKSQKRQEKEEGKEEQKKAADESGKKEKEQAKRSKTHIFATSTSACSHFSSFRLSLSISVLAACLPFPTAVPK